MKICYLFKGYTIKTLLKIIINIHTTIYKYIVRKTLVKIYISNVYKNLHKMQNIKYGYIRI